MATSIFKFPLLLITLILAFIIGQQTNTGGRLQAEPPKSDSRLKQLLKDRVDAKKKMVEVLTKLNAARAASFEIQMARIEQFRSELDLLDTNTERVYVLEQILDVRKQIARELGKRPGCGAIEMIQTEIAVLEAEIEVEREKLKA